MNIKKNDIIKPYILKLAARCSIPTKFNIDKPINLYTFHYNNQPNEIIALVNREKSSDESKTPYLRIHSACITSEIFGSMKCDCAYQFDYAMNIICNSTYGIMLYMSSHEGRGIGLENKIKAYQLQEKGANTISANLQLGLPVDSRDFSPVIAVLDYFHVNKVNVLTNNPQKIAFLKKNNIGIESRLPITPPLNDFNKDYIIDKQDLMNHDFGSLVMA